MVIMVTFGIITIGGVVLLTGSALLALRWALRTGQFKHPAKTALQIFDETEPVGQVTDCFPRGRRPGPRPGFIKRT